MTDTDALIKEFMMKTVKNVTVCLRSSFDLPVKGNSEDSIFNEYPKYQKVLNGLSLKVLNIVQQLIDKQDGKGNLLDSAEKKDLDDKFNILVEVNDRLLDKCNNIISSIENPDVIKTTNIVIAEYAKSKENLSQDNSKLTPQQTIKLLSSVQVERPQLKFSKLPENSKISFRPILTTKPNAIELLEKSLINSDEEQYPHPYGAELNIFTAPGQQLISKSELEFPKSLEETNYEYVDTLNNLTLLIDKLKTENEISVDLEHHNVRTYLGLTCLIQISTRSTDFVIDTLALHDHMEILNEIFTNPKILKVFHGSNSDLMWLQRDFGVYVINMFDTGQACQAMNFPRKSLSYLLEKYCNIQANKEYQRLTDWRIRPLIPELIEYARTDTHYLLYIYDCLHKELVERDLLVQVYESSRQLCYRLYKKPVCDLDQCMELYRKSSENFNPRQLYAYKRLWELRDNIAREEDESSPFVLPNRILLSIAQGLPRETSGVLACCSQDWKLPLLRKYVYDFQKICLEAYNESLTDTDKAVVVKKNVLDFLLSKHDRTVTNDDQLKISLDQKEIEDKMKVQDSLIKTNRGKILPMDISMIRIYLQHHSMGNGLVLSEEKPIPVPEEKKEEEPSSDVEIVHLNLSESTDALMNVSDNQSDKIDVSKIALPSLKRNASTTESPFEKKKPRNVIPFDYKESLNQLRQTSSNNQQRGGKQFQPFSSKKFKGNNKRKT